MQLRLTIFKKKKNPNIDNQINKIREILFLVLIFTSFY